jgi:hypothetical protein
LFGPNAYIEIVGQIEEEKFSHDIYTGVILDSNTSSRKVEKHTPAHNMTHSFNEVSIEWNNKKILWKLNDQLINDVDFKEFSAGIAQNFNHSFRLVMDIVLRTKSYNDSNFNLSNIHKPYLYIDYIKVYKPKETSNKTNSFPNAKKTEIDLHSNLGANNTNSFPNANKTETALHPNLGANNANSFLNTNKTFRLLLVILVVFIL